MCSSNTQQLPAPQSNTKQLPAPQSNTKQLPAPQSNTQQLPAPQSNTQQLPASQSNTQQLPAPQSNTKATASITKQHQAVEVHYCSLSNDIHDSLKQCRKLFEMQMLPVMLLPNKKHTKVLLATFVFQKASCIA